MPFKEVAYPEDLTAMIGETESGPLQSILQNQSPIIKLWAVVMVINFLMMAFILF